MRRTDEQAARVAALLGMATAWTVAACTGGPGAGAVAAAGMNPITEAAEHVAGASPPTPPESASPTASSSDEHAVFSLVDNRWLAHLEHQGGLLVRAGTPGFAKYTRFGRPKQAWTLGQRQGSRAVARLDKRASLDVPLSDAQAAGARRVTLSLHAADRRKLVLSVNGKKLKRVELERGWQVVSLAVPAGRLVAGENTLQLDVGRGKPLSLEWLLVGRAAPEADDAGALTADGLELRKG